MVMPHLVKVPEFGVFLNSFDCFDLTENYKEGPFSILYNCIEKKKQLKVWTRRLHGLRGLCVGYVVAFDKHMNLVSDENQNTTNSTTSHCPDMKK